ncbi:hypothetical protein A2926_01195 [Candidatus Giovannonibacteria bacterium RIFCSPLOWO2_01_FULL_44_40]|uniref:Methylisocitrate lyase n=1 Tax=Candidatus Giovannonibacteria bacterium RIFCSPHIGHO2_01_FULL_45_23 TaxID=1798325 RepID=A0A1F5VHY3_9BACT|nr:MAG: hypothetical protein A2834_03205 [Candidatus Giovannonibacteria bacterium RIFCSPHIGHO2_01_FULL_45_23]OGF75776.1 MAG: hypothetical protein A3C77_00520 [Candidatus Giovannonibacteria bacterium RIFCSPHIGHO2_02_FULL_45_13]OGF79550.1 MAG: hypothetical protein A2926_01195 [Candidatus Giovannonibacteria bacterium RIFCSPLOWO2_01_FULL_44_40]
MNFKKLLGERKHLILIGITEPIEALIAQAEGYKAAYISGAALSTKLGFLDEGLISLEKMAQVVSDIRKVSDLPLLVDCDTGLLTEENQSAEMHPVNDALPAIAHTMMHLLWGAGANAVQIEDQVPAKKRCGHLSGKELISMNDMFWKIKMLAHWKKNEDQVIVARTDARAAEGLDGAIFRAHRYINAGADAIFPEALEALEEFKEFRRQVPTIPLVANLAEHGKTPPMCAEALFEAGYQMVLIPATIFRMELLTFLGALKEIKGFNSLNRSIFDGRLISRTELNKFIKKHSKIYLPVRQAGKKKKTAD